MDSAAYFRIYTMPNANIPALLNDLRALVNVISAEAVYGSCNIVAAVEGPFKDSISTFACHVRKMKGVKNVEIEHIVSV